MGQPSQTQVDTGELRAVAATVEAVARDLGTVHPRHAADLVPSAATAGWGCVATARSASAAWSGFLTALSESVGGTGADLRTAADDYDAADRAARDRLRHGGRWIE